MINYIGQSKNYGKFVVIEHLYKTYYKIRFVNTGYESKARKDDIINGAVKDRLIHSVAGVGYLGNIRVTEKDHHKLYQLWRNILCRCYNKNRHDYNRYGGAGVTVSNRWFCFKNFVDDIVTLDGWDKDLFYSNKIQLDKDKLQFHIDRSLRVYSKDTCCWLTSDENRKYQTYRKVMFKAIAPDNTEYIRYNIREFTREFPEYNLNHKRISECFNGQHKHHRGWKFIRLVGRDQMRRVTM